MNRTITPTNPIVTANNIPSTFYSGRVRVTPEMASAWLAQRNKNNRPVMPERVAKYATDLKAGSWPFHHQGIGFDREGTILDGQHRLMAVVEAGVAVDMLVTTGLDPETFDYVDQHGVRKLSDLLSRRMPDLKNKTFVGACAAAMLKGLQDGIRQPKKETLEFTIQNVTIIAHFVTMMRTGPRILQKAPVCAAFCNAVRGPDNMTGGHGSRDFTTVSNMCKRLVSQEWRDARDPMKALFNRILKEETTKREGRLTGQGRLTGAEFYSLTVSAIRADLQGQPLSKVEPTTIEWGHPSDRGQRPRAARTAETSYSPYASSDNRAAAE